MLLTFVGRKVLMTSLSCDVAPPGAREIWSELPLGVADPETSISIGVDAMAAMWAAVTTRSIISTRAPDEAKVVGWWKAEHRIVGVGIHWRAPIQALSCGRVGHAWWGYVQVHCFSATLISNRRRNSWTLYLYLYLIITRGNFS